MPYFAYKGRNAKGELVQGNLESPDSGTVADQLVGSGIIPVEIFPAAGSVKSSAEVWLGRALGQRVKPIDLMLFSRQMYTLLKAGVPMLRSLAGLQESTQNPALVEVIRSVRTSLDSGREFSAAMRQHPDVFSPLYISLVQVGEITGLLDEVFLRLYRHLEFEKEMRERVRAALRYPAFVVVAMVIALAVVNVFVIPAFSQVFKGFHVQLPLMTRLLIGVSDFSVRFWPLVLALAAAAYFGFRAYTRTTVGKYHWDKIKLRIPIAGPIILKATLARFARSFALAIKSGVPLVQALSVVARVVDNEFVARHIEQMRDGIERGESISRTATNTGIFTAIVLQMIAVGEETGELDDLMREVAEMYERDVDYEVKTLGAQLEPILISGLAVLVLILALGIFLPIWELGKVSIRY